MRHKKVKTCTKCGQPAELVTHRTICRPCNLARKRAVSARHQSTAPGAEYNRRHVTAYRRTPSGRAKLLVYFASRRAKDSEMEFSLSHEDVVTVLARGVCEATGLPFDMGPSVNKHRANPWAPSLDRRDNSKGYTPDNVQVVCAAYNYAKNEFTPEVLLTVARAIVDKAYTKR